MSYQRLKTQILESLITRYATKTKLWNLPDVSVLLSEDAKRREAKTSIISLFKRACGDNAYKGYHDLHRELRMPFHFIPSCSRFTATLKPYDWVFALFGLAIRGKGSGVQIRNWKSGKANRYLFGMFLQLGRLRDAGDMENYWRLGWRLMNTHAYQVSAFNYTASGWYKTKSVAQVNKLMSELKGLVESQATEINFKRVYIPKGDGRVRPLGVPSLSWRVYLHMLNNLIVWTRTGTEGTQHAYFPGRGVHTCWSEVLSKISSPNIYEFDLKGFFDNVDLQHIYTTLIDAYGYPEEMSSFLRKMNRSIPKLAEKDELPEPDRGLTYTADLKPNPNKPKTAAALALEESIYGQPWSGVLSNVRDMLAAQWSSIPIGGVLTSGAEGSHGWKEKGVPQGAATSCSLSTVSLTHLTSSERLSPCMKGLPVEVVMYADDGLIFLESSSDLEKVLSEFEAAGVEINKMKSGWVKQNGTWLKDIKFLGIVYSWLNNTIKASTRKGSTLEFSVKEQFLAFLLERREAILLSGSARHLNNLESYKGVSVKSWVLTELISFFSLHQPQSLLFKGTWSGYFLSSLYCDSWSKLDPVSHALEISNTGCWVNACWPRYGRETVNSMTKSLLKCELATSMISWKRGRLVPAFRDWSAFFLEIKPYSPKDEMLGLIREVKGSAKLIERVEELLLALKYVTLKQAVCGSPEGVDQLWYALLNPVIGSEDDLIDAVYTYAAGNTQNIDYLRENPPQVDYLPDGGVKFKLFSGETEHFSSEQVGRIQQTIGSCLDLNAYNASSFACDDLLSNYPLPEGVRGRSKSLVSHYLYPGLPRAVDKVENAPRVVPHAWIDKLKRKIIREFRRVFGSKPTL